MEKSHVGLIGLGTMGTGMAANLLRAGFPLAVYNRTQAKAEPFGPLGARVAGTPAALATGSNVIISMLADDAASRNAWLGPDGALAAAEPGTVLVEASTVSPTWIAELAKLAGERSLALLDAPVTGSRVQASEGQLTFLVGGNKDALEKVAPVLQAMGKEVVHLGPTGSGAKLKLLNNFLCGVQVASLAEGLTWLERSGLDIAKSLSILKVGAPGSPLLGALSTRMTNNDYTVNFLLKLMAKDLEYAAAAARTLGVQLTMAASAEALFEEAIAQGYAEKDMSSVIEPVRNKHSSP